MTNAHDAPASGSHAQHDDDEHPAEDPRWVLVPLVVGLVIGLVVAIVFGLGSGVPSLV